MPSVIARRERHSPPPGFGLSLGITKPVASFAKGPAMIEHSKRHLSAAGENYFEHLGAALGISATLARASICCALHAILPSLCTRSASRSIAELHQKLQRRGAAASDRRGTFFSDGRFAGAGEERGP